MGDGLQQTPLFYSVHWEWWEIVELLLQKGCDINTTDAQGRTALHCAVDCTDIRPLKMLIELVYKMENFAVTITTSVAGPEDFPTHPPLLQK